MDEEAKHQATTWGIVYRGAIGWLHIGYEFTLLPERDILLFFNDIDSAEAAAKASHVNNSEAYYGVTKMNLWMDQSQGPYYAYIQHYTKKKRTQKAKTAPPLYPKEQRPPKIKNRVKH